jgi:hypothetical protein
VTRRARASAAAIAAVASLSSWSGAAWAQFCPSYTASSVNNDAGCAIEAVPGQNPLPEEWAEIFDIVSQGPAVWGDDGPTVADISAGCDAPEPTIDVPARFPCELLKAIAMAESGWRQFCVPTTPSDQVGGPERTIISFDCGYGIGQVTSGMHDGETPDFDRERVASEPFYNLATGTRILAEKWGYTECVGDHQPEVIEHWYIATWAYNGLAYVNNPNNPNHDPNRGVYDPAIGGSAPYQEKVFGRIEHPTEALWPSVALAYPPLGEIGGGSSPAALGEPSCASPTDCSESRVTHVTECQPVTGQGGAGSGGEASQSTGGAGMAGGYRGELGGSGPEAMASSSGEEDGCGCRIVGRGESDSTAALPLALIALLGLGRNAGRRWRRAAGIPSRRAQ